MGGAGAAGTGVTGPCGAVSVFPGARLLTIGDANGEISGTRSSRRCASVRAGPDAAGIALYSRECGAPGPGCARGLRTARPAAEGALAGRDAVMPGVPSVRALVRGGLMWGLWGRTGGAGCGGPRVRAWRNGVKGQNEKRACVVARGEVPRVQREAGSGG